MQENLTVRVNMLMDFGDVDTAKTAILADADKISVYEPIVAGGQPITTYYLDENILLAFEVNIKEPDETWTLIPFKIE